MSRILKRPMFRKGGLSQETGIMSGLDSPRRSYAGGGNIGGGSISGNPMGSRTGFVFPGMEYYGEHPELMKGVGEKLSRKWVKRGRRRDEKIR